MVVDVVKLKGKYYELVQELNDLLDYGMSCGIEELEDIIHKLGRYIFLLESGCDIGKLKVEICNYIKRYIHEDYTLYINEEDEVDLYEEPEIHFIP
jgi:hypothetical protein